MGGILVFDAMDKINWKTGCQSYEGIAGAWAQRPRRRINKRYDLADPTTTETKADVVQKEAYLLFFHFLWLEKNVTSCVL